MSRSDRQHWHSSSNDSRIGLVTPSTLLALCLILAPLAFAQTRTKTNTSRTEGHKLASVNIVGSDRYTPAEVMAAVGLRIGNIASEDDFNRATRDLASTGLFSDVAYTYSFDATGTHLEMKLQDNTRLVPTHFQNIVWFSDDKLLAELRERVPLFHGQVPLSGNLADQVSDAIQAMLLENKFPGHVDYTRVGPEGGPIDAVNFAVDNVALRVQQLAIAGAQPADLAALQPKLTKLENREYTQAAVSAFADKELLPYYFSRGYLKASFGPPQPKVAQQTEDDTMLDVALPLAQGPAYQLAGIEWSGNKEIATEQLQNLFHLSLNQPANAVQIDSALREVEQLYGSKGYVKAAVKPVPHFDDAKDTVTFDLQVHEGDLYKMGELEIRGVDSKTSSQMLERWAIHQGTPYDSAYAKRFIEEAWKLLPSRVDWNVSAHEAVDERDKVVDVSLIYSVQSPPQQP